MQSHLYKIKNFIELNWFISDITKCFVAQKSNRVIREYIAEVSQIDSISDIKIFKEVLKKVPSGPYNSCATEKRAFGENLYYGYAQALMEYASIPMREIFYFPLLEHGIVAKTDSIDFNRYTRTSSYIFQGRSTENLWRARKDFKPIYYVGPYIHYANDYYSSERIKKEKKKIGNTLLLFPPHSTEEESATFAQNKFYEDIIKLLGSKYSNIIACYYYIDLLNTDIEQLLSNGIQVVSAGYRSDPLFISRLKTIIKLSDAVVYPSFTSSIGYAYYLNKQVYCLDYKSRYTAIDNSIIDEKIIDELKCLESKFWSVFSLDSTAFNEKQSDLVEQYWGINDLKQPNEIYRMYEENKKRILTRLGF